MKLLLFSDLHADKAMTSQLVAQAQVADVLIGAGDLANVRRNLNVCISLLRQVNRPTILVAGNNETTDELIVACQGWPSVHVLHGSSVTVNNLTFYGIGGAIPITPFGAWSYDLSEEQATELLINCPSGCILVSHSPPYGAVDVSSQGKHLGSTAIRDAVIRTQPRLVVCGHIHASGGQREMIGSTPVINAGPQGMLWQLAE
ncbi:MAG: metallophosphoesterase [Anaerolineae bacterium]